MKTICATLASLLLATAAHAEWYRGGDLHRADGAGWHQAGNDNRMATSADFIVTVGDRLTFDATDFDEIYLRSINLVACLDEVFAEPSIRSLQVAEVAMLCMAQMGWVR
ncbi:MAG: hypothetical protein ACXIVF_15595 [Rhizobiaceae bacterium]